jgi:hypothetical protein
MSVFPITVYLGVYEHVSVATLAEVGIDDSKTESPFKVLTPSVLIDTIFPRIAIICPLLYGVYTLGAKN